MQAVLFASGLIVTSNVFLGLALDKLNRNDDAERAYQVASKSRVDDALVWQGLINLYEKQANKKIDEYGVAAQRLAHYFAEHEDRHRCQSVIDKYVGFAKEHGTRSQYRAALEVMLPTSNLYDFLEGRLPHPSSTYAKVAEIAEAEEKERINKLIGERRTKLGARIGQVVADVKQEVYAGSNVESLYNSVVEWSHDDDIRHLYEERLLQHAYDVLSALPHQKKAEKRAEVLKMAEGMVIIRHPCLLAWNITLEWKDVEKFTDTDEATFRDYVKLFPDDGLAKVIKGFLESELAPLPRESPANGTQNNSSDEDTTASPVDHLALMTEGLEQSSRSVLSHRIVCEYYLHLQEYPGVVQLARHALEQLRTEKQISGLKLHNVADTLQNALATALVQYETPRHHSEARGLFEEILRRKPSNSVSLIGIGMILQEEEDYEAANTFLQRALKKAPDLSVRSEAAWCKALMGDYDASFKELQSCLEDYDVLETPNKDLKSEVLFRLGVCQWNLDPTKSARKDRNGAYAKFLASLQANMAYAPAYTKLGIYYADYAKDKTRARKCFQKALELSSSEVEAAERLARAFAQQTEWDLVEAVAQRVIESGKIRPPPGSKRKGISWPFAALGVCQLNNQEYPKAIASFQSALRIAPKDYHSWVGLGESYHNSGRYLAAIKAFEQSQTLEGQVDNDDAWFSRFMLASVHRELGDFQHAVAKFEEVLTLKSDELGVLMALLQTLFESAWRFVEMGVFGEAAHHALRALAVAKDVLKHDSDAFNLWKCVGDACSVFSWIGNYASSVDQASLAKLLKFEMRPEMYDLLSDVDGIGANAVSAFEQSTSPLESCLRSAVLAHKRAIHCSAHDVHAQAVSWYNLGWTEHRYGASVVDSTKRRNQHLRASVRCFKRAIELEARNSEFWNALGIATTQLNLRIAQHSFVRSLHLNERAARTWTNLGILYLLQNDTELANMAFTRGQSADPEYAHAWLGQGILALLLGDTKEAQGLFTHAFEIADSASFPVKRLFSLSTFDLVNSSPRQAYALSDLLQPLFALHQLRTQDSSDIVAQHLTALFTERIGDHVETVDTLAAVCTSVEAEYEVSESALSLARFAQAKADLARAQLASGQYAAAAENAQTALDLSDDADSGASEQTARHSYRLSAHLTAGLAAHYQGHSDDAIVMFRTALDESNGHPDAVCVLAQVLWAKGEVAERDVAREQLLACVEAHPDHAGAIGLLATIALLDGDAAMLDAVAADLHALRTRSDISTHKQQRLVWLVGAIARSGPDGGPEQERAEAATSIQLSPSEPHGWAQMARLAAHGEDHPAMMARLTAFRSAPPRGSLGAEDLARAFAGTGKRSDAQSAIMMAPWVEDAWDGLL